MKQIVLASALGLMFLVIGIVCLFWPKRIQQFALDYHPRHKVAVFLEKLDLFPDWEKTRGYILSLRIIGVMAIGAFVLLLFVVIQLLQR